MAKTPKLKCPMCKKMVPKSQHSDEEMPMVAKGRHVGWLTATLAECCSQLYIREGFKSRPAKPGRLT